MEGLNSEVKRNKQEARRVGQEALGVARRKGAEAKKLLIEVKVL